MTEADQQRLIQPEPTRVIRAIPGSAWWGVDPSTLRVAVAWQHPAAEPGAAIRSFPRAAAGGKRLSLIRSETADFVRGIVGAPWPGIVLVEQPSGKPNPALVYAVGAIQAGIYDGLRATPRGHHHPEQIPPIETITSSEWRLIATGRGDTGYKRRGGKAELVRLAQENGYRGSSEDESEAWLIALAARRLVRFEA